LFVGALVPDSPPVSAPCSGMHGPSSGAYNSVILDASYTAAVGVSEAFQTRALILATGTVNQPSGADITVVGGAAINSENSFALRGRGRVSWTGGAAVDAQIH